MDKRSTQLPLPLIEVHKENKEVKQHWELTFARQPKISVVAKRMIALVLAQIADDNNDSLRPYYELNASQVVKDTLGGSAYTQCTNAFHELAQIAWKIKDIDGRKDSTSFQLITTDKTVEEDGFRAGYDEGRITIAINKALKPYFIELSQYSKFYLTCLNFSSWYSFRFWEILSAFKDTGYWRVSLEDYRGYMDCVGKYKRKDKNGVLKDRPNELVSRTTKEPLEDLKGTDLEFTIEKVFADKRGGGKKPLWGLQFNLKNYPLNITQKLDKWGTTDPEFKRLIDRGRHWEISDQNLYDCLQVIGREKAWKLFKQFAEKQASNDRMNNISKFCNGAILSAAGLRKDDTK